MKIMYGDSGIITTGTTKLYGTTSFWSIMLPTFEVQVGSSDFSLVSLVFVEPRAYIRLSV